MKEPDRRGRREFSLAANLALELGVSIIICAAIGYFLDKTFRTSPWFIFGAIVLGTMAGFWNAFKIISRRKDKTSQTK